jgi:hypothetical protein
MYILDVSPCRIVVIMPITFLSSERRLEFPPFDGGTGALLQSQRGVEVSVHRAGQASCTSRVANCHSVEELGFQLLEWRDMTLLQGGAEGSTGLLCTLRKQGFWSHLQNSRLLLSSPVGILVFSLFDGRMRALLLSGTVGSVGPPCCVGRMPIGASRIAKPGAWSSLRCVVAGSWH